jgi:hypothetical protein
MGLAGWGWNLLERENPGTEPPLPGEPEILV